MVSLSIDRPTSSLYMQKALPCVGEPRRRNISGQHLIRTREAHDHIQSTQNIRRNHESLLLERVTECCALAVLVSIKDDQTRICGLHRRLSYVSVEVDRMTTGNAEKVEREKWQNPRDGED